jgi:CRISPR-associated protein Csb3
MSANAEDRAMSEVSVPVDLFNPGQVFACLGLLEAAEQIVGGAEGGFDWTDRDHARFRLRGAGTPSPVEAVLDFLASARVHSEAPARCEHETTKWGVPTRQLLPGASFPYPAPDSPATLPAVIEGTAELAGVSSVRIVIDHWGDQTRRDAVKFWAGAGGYPGAALVRDALDLVRRRAREVIEDPFGLAAEQSSSFRFDWRRDNIPIDLGFNMNVQPRIGVAGFPLVELLAAIGLTHARPFRDDRLSYRYAVVAGAQGELLDPILLRASLGGAALPFPQRHFRMRLGWPGKEGQARAITTVTEEHPQ